MKLQTSHMQVVMEEVSGSELENIVTAGGSIQNADKLQPNFKDGKLTFTAVVGIPLTNHVVATGILRLLGIIE